jgi:3-dehydroquinate synthase
MEVSLVDSFIVNSSIQNYEVFFKKNIFEILNKEARNGDIIVIDNIIKNLYPNLLNKISNKIIAIDANEEQKSYIALVPIINELISSGFKKNNRLIGIGGGITQDVTAFISSIIFRGVKWIFFPTTLLAQGDSCIGSKTSINFKNYKNQIGGFYPPIRIYIDTNFLRTLSKEDMQSGLGEMSHYFVVAGEEEFNEYKLDYNKVGKDPNILKKMILNSLKIKKSYIEIDEYDQKERQIFNYGHSFGHAIESLTDYSVPHGIAVSFGMDIANFVSMKKDFISNSIRNEIRQLLKQIWNGYNIKNINVEKFILALRKDKKNIDDDLQLILCKGYGKVFKVAQQVDVNFISWLNEYFKFELE